MQAEGILRTSFKVAFYHRLDGDDYSPLSASTATATDVRTAQEEKTAAPLGRYFRRFTLQNVRTFRSPVVLDFCHSDGTVAQWTVILGENGTGKTTLLQYLAGMMPVQDRDLGNLPAKTKSGNKPLPFRPLVSTEDWIQWHVENLPLYWIKPMKMEAKLEVSCSAQSFADASANKAQPFGFQFIADHTVDGRPTIKFQFTGVDSVPFYEEFRLFGYGASRHIAGPASPYLTSETFFQNGGSSPVSTIFHDDHPLISPEQWFFSLDHSAARSTGKAADRLTRALKSVSRCLTNSLPDVREIVVGPHGYITGKQIMSLLCSVPYSPRPLPFRALSVGYRTMAAWLTDFIKRMHDAFPNLDEPDNGPAVVLIDEFDLHMHPAWQRKAMAALSREFPNTQFIVTAHSPLVVQAANMERAKILVLQRRKRDDGLEEVVVVDHPSETAGWRVDQILESLYRVSADSPRYEEVSRERVRLRQKEKLTAVEKRQLAAIEVELEQLTPPDEAEASKALLSDLKKALEKACGEK